ncbi:hypothetical protein CA233_15025 [Sphingomonas sp. ABOLD]|uniref:Lipoprotein n=1 Tax=Sphingomonas trueperi TaxID=53317 RepID=A0A7X6BD61_9SPHN|nr:MULTISPECIES: hypothetical protein [Sphingomonas]NJB98313.1 hypothetical protein [Sphingomonas trueperi]RSV44771.1 hypothetical protein CA233_15025 [Sphingomonas sp. ABOLD]RSV45455.1 hypothetical protein CA234_00965 [Sphingomonas sp. ABOLE]
MRLLSLFAGVGLIALAGCVPAPSTPPPASAPRPLPVPAPAPPPPAPTRGADWRDWPLTPGDWRYRAGSATYGVAGGAPLATLRCDLAARRVTLSRTGKAPTTLTLRTTSAVRAIPATPDIGASGMIAMTFAANDGFLDALGFSRGRFVIEGGGLPVLVIPAWPEILRVVEDCRK